MFDHDHPEQLLDAGRCAHVWWKRTGRRKAEGSWMRCWGQPSYPLRTHASIGLSVFETVFQEKLLAYLKVASRQADADFALLDSIPLQYASFAMASSLASWTRRGDPSTCRIFVTTHTLRHWLPDMPWAVVFGPAYVRMFGKEKLLSTPAHHVEDIGPEMVFIQLTPRLEDIHEQFEMVMTARALAKRHLGEDAFFKPELTYDYKDEANKNKAGKVFRVPVFELKSD
ncbi:MAG: hypothetical protein ABFC42_11095 [Sulfuricella sp.]